MTEPHSQPIVMIWTGAEMVPLDRYRPLCATEYKIGEEYPLVVMQQTSDKNRNHYFAMIKEGWDNLPEAVAKKFPSSEHLRHWCLVQAGYFTERDVAVGDGQKAKELALLCRELDPYAVINVSDDVIKIYRAKSQSRHVMGTADFNASKQAVLEIIAGMVQVSPDTLSQNAGTSA